MRGISQYAHHAVWFIVAGSWWVGHVSAPAAEAAPYPAERSAPASNASGCNVSLQLDEAFQSNMVLQHTLPCVAGVSTSPVTLQMGPFNVRAQHTGCRFVACLPPQRPSDLEADLTLRSAHGAEATLHRVVFGDVYYCVGQSNMLYPLEHNDPSYYKTFSHFAYRPQLERELALRPPIWVYTKRQWRRATARPRAVQSLGKFPAPCWFFGLNLAQALQDWKARPWPVGLLADGQVGAPLVSFMPVASVAKCPKPQCTSMVPGTCGWMNRHKRELRGIVELPRFAGMLERRGDFEKVQTLPLRAILFYQGESDIATSGSYHCRQRELVSHFRRVWGPRLAFVFTVVAGFKEACGTLPFVRREQLRLVSHPTLRNVGAATAHDLGYPTNIHPPDKREVGRRLALTVQALVYGRVHVVHEGPRLQRVQVRHAGPVYAEVAFDFKTSVVLNGTADCVACCTLVPFLFSFDARIADDTSVAASRPVRNFTCHDQSDRWARGTRVSVEGSQVLVHVPLPAGAGRGPSFARFQYEDEPQCGLYNRNRLPAFPFEVPLAPLGQSHQPPPMKAVVLTGKRAPERVPLPLPGQDLILGPS